ncbi:MAG: HAD hydrolase-like protein [Halapricum sp.]
MLETEKHLLNAVDVAPERAVFVGNNYETDVIGAAAAGIASVLVGDLPAEASVEPVATVDTPGDVPDVL